MKQYIQGYYGRDDLHLQVLNKDSNRKILAALRDAYPDGLSVEELSSKANLPEKTIYAQKAELYREYYVNHVNDSKEQNVAKRGRPSLAESRASEALRKRVRIVGEETYGIFDPFKGSKPTPLPPGNVIYTEGFTDVCDKMIGKEERSDLYNDLSYYIERILNRVNEYDTTEGRKSRRAWSPEKSPEYCCSQCGLNHEARDFLRAVLLRLIDQFQSSRKFIEILKTNGFISQECYERILEELVEKS